MTKEEILEYFKDINHAYNDCTRYDTLKRMIDELQEPCDDMGEVSDGYHTFNQLYHQRAVLFATIVNQNKDKSWKSFKHSDGNYCFDSNGEWFIVGIDTPQGSYTYHYAKEYWDMFDCEELERSKEWDGHTEEDVTRLLSLGQEPCENAIKYFNIINELSETLGVPYSFVDEEIKEITKALKALPPVTPAEKVGQWIPVSERLPEQDKSGCSNWHSVKVFAQIKSYTGKTEIVKGCFIEFGDVMAFELDEYPLCVPDGWDVITLDKDNRAYNEEYPEEYVELQAWMPLPEPYKASPTGEEVDA